MCKNSYRFVQKAGRRCTDESENYISLHRMQTEKLQHHEKQKEYSRQIGTEQVLQILQKAYDS